MSKSHKIKKEAEKKYREVLAKMRARVGQMTTYSNQLQKEGKKLFKSKFKGVFPADKIPSTIAKSDLMIVNLDKSHEPGSHWVGVGRDKTDGIIWVYDSFGRNLHKILPTIYYHANVSKHVKATEQDAEQKEEEEDCGARTLAFLFILNKYGSKYAKYI